jgi:deazaflavin-dependent oxidoreductase (nitroreductase family)
MAWRERIRNRVRYFNKRVTNRLLRVFAYAPRGPFALVRHVGRKSGKAYETPIFAFRHDGNFVIALTYGPDVDWYRNVQAAGKCGLHWHGQDYAIDKIETLDVQTALPAFPLPIRLVLPLVGQQDYVRMTTEGRG